MGSVVPHPIPLVTAWDVSGLDERAPLLTTTEIQTMLAASAALELEDFSYITTLLNVRNRYVDAASSKDEAGRRAREVLGNARLLQAGQRAVKAAEAGPAWKQAARVGLIVQVAAVALYLEDWLEPRDFARALWPIVSALGEPRTLAGPR